MTATLITEQAKRKIQPLVKSPVFKHSLNNFLTLTKAYTDANKIVPSINLFGPKRRKYNRMLKNVQQIDDVYIFRDKNNRFIFTIKADKDNTKTAILLDLLNEEEMETFPQYRNNKTKRTT
ncbi:hypothetical protein [Cytobacillus sp. Bac17]|uniref:hypothetical protein n=1 Tax=Cytobacillus sp. Bac17 TaxID=2926008 RepID=UPI0021181402|nr:hypothetical protein [Cytobacillus sp. Bac17]